MYDGDAAQDAVMASGHDVHDASPRDDVPADTTIIWDVAPGDGANATASGDAAEIDLDHLDVALTVDAAGDGMAIRDQTSEAAPTSNGGPMDVHSPYEAPGFEFTCADGWWPNLSTGFHLCCQAPLGCDDAMCAADLADLGRHRNGTVGRCYSEVPARCYRADMN